MKMYLVPVSLTVSMMAPGALAGAGTISGASGHPAVLQLQAHTLSLQQLLEQPLDQSALSILEDLSYQLESDLLQLGSPAAPVADPLESLHRVVEHCDASEVKRCAGLYLAAARRWLSGLA